MVAGGLSDNLPDHIVDTRDQKTPASQFNNMVNRTTSPSASCNMSLYHTLVCTACSPPVIPRDLLTQCNRILYNRVPKTASRTIYKVFQELSPQHNIHNIYNSLKYWWFTEHNRAKLAGRLQGAMNSGFILTCHYYFDRFSEILGDTGVYIELIREPGSWFQSFINWKKYGEEGHPGARRYLLKHNRRYLESTIEDEIKAGRSVVNLFRESGALHFLCGQHPICSTPSTASFQRALENVQQKYLVVGILEDLPGFMEVLEYLMPHVFSNMSTIYYNQSEASTVTKSIYKERVNDTVLHLLYNQVPLEVKLYNIVKNRFYSLLNAIRQLKAVS